MGKSTCCRGPIRRFGKRRRQCGLCRRTWTVWLKKRGRPLRRADRRLVRRVFQQRRSLTQIAEQQGLTRQALSYRFLRALEREAAGPKSMGLAPQVHLTLLADGMWFRFRRRPWTLYLMAMKEPGRHKAVFLDPLLRSGSESRLGWETAFGTIPPESRQRIRALVCDNFAGSNNVAKKNGWVLQLCHFHLLASLHKRLGRRHPANVPSLALRHAGYQLVREILLDLDDKIETRRQQLRALADNDEMPWRFGNILREFARRLPAYQAYRLHPELRLPRTTGSVESMGRVIRDLLRQTRSLSTPNSVNLWIKTLLRTRPEITCNPGQISTD